MPTTPSASWVAECAACHHSNPARAHFCSVCGAPLQSPAAAAARASAAAAPETTAGDPPEPKGFMLHFNDDNSLAIAPRYTAPDAGDADTAAPSGANPAGHAARQQPHAEFHFSLPGPQPQAQERAQPSASRVNWSNATVAGAMLALTAIVGSGSYLLGRSSLTSPTPLAGYQAPAPAMATALGTVPAQPPAALHTAAATPPGADGLQPAQSSPGQAQQALAPLAPTLPAQPVAAATVPAATVAQATPARAAAPQAVAAPGAAARGAPAAMPCNATVAALGLCEP
ncbi:zinc ribbon domain-containing protein [Azohydromonas australica]|uniref:zinc ribbon domain-containing protein n=1 Tax=Azohydromonas australica TaxID=364039 RepID=UPI0004294727|nr:zinc ribbon domain-containing protein [Azohydromonas australica]